MSGQRNLDTPEQPQRPVRARPHIDMIEDAPGKFVELSQGMTHYRLFGKISGHAPLLVCVHDVGTAHDIWDQPAEKLKMTGYTVLTFDLFGALCCPPLDNHSQDHFVGRSWTL